MAKGKKEQPRQPLRRGEVIKAIQVDMDFESAIDRDFDDAAFAEVQKRHRSTMSALTSAEYRHVSDARQRHGYGA